MKSSRVQLLHPEEGGEEMSNTLKEYADKELARIEEKRQAAITAQGGHPFLAPLGEGENLLVLLGELPKEGRYGKVFTVRKPHGTEVFSQSIREESPLYREYLNALGQAPCLLRIIRVGKDKSNTRYSVSVSSIGDN